MCWWHSTRRSRRSYGSKVPPVTWCVPCRTDARKQDWRSRIASSSRCKRGDGEMLSRLVETHGATVQNETLATELTLGALPEGAHRSVGGAGRRNSRVRHRATFVICTEAVSGKAAMVNHHSRFVVLHTVGFAHRLVFLPLDGQHAMLGACVDQFG